MLPLTMGNMVMNQRLKEDIGGGGEQDDKDHGSGGGGQDRRIFPKHMYNGPLKLGDPVSGKKHF